MENVIDQNASYTTVGSEAIKSGNFKFALAKNWGDISEQIKADMAIARITPFQHYFWLDSWYRHFVDNKSISARIITIRDADGILVMHLPLIKQKKKFYTQISFADLNLCDFNAPILGPAAPSDEKSARILFALITKSLDGDVIHFEKMPERIGSWPNPLLLGQKHQNCALNGNLILINKGFEAYRRSLARHNRKELERKWRHFSKVPDPGFQFAQDSHSAANLFEFITKNQQVRLESLGVKFVLNSKVINSFYADLLQNGFQQNFVKLTALTSQNNYIAGLMMVNFGSDHFMIRLAHAQNEFAHCSPGSLILDRTMKELSSQGFQRFELSVGNFAYKRRMGTVPVPLFNQTRALRPKGLLLQWRNQFVGWLRHHPNLDRIVRKILKISDPATEKATISS